MSLSSSDVVTDRGVREIVLRPFRPDHVVRPELHLQFAALVDTEPFQNRLRSVLVDVCRGARNAPNCDDVGHLPTHTGNRAPKSFPFVRSYHEPVFFVRAVVLRGVRADDHRADKGPSQ